MFAASCTLTDGRRYRTSFAPLLAAGTILLAAATVDAGVFVFAFALDAPAAAPAIQAPVPPLNVDDAAAPQQSVDRSSDRGGTQLSTVPHRGISDIALPLALPRLPHELLDLDPVFSGLLEPMALSPLEQVEVYRGVSGDADADTAWARQADQALPAIGRGVRQFCQDCGLVSLSRRAAVVIEDTGRDVLRTGRQSVQKVGVLMPQFVAHIVESLPARPAKTVTADIELPYDLESIITGARLQAEEIISKITNLTPNSTVAAYAPYIQELAEAGDFDFAEDDNCHHDDMAGVCRPVPELPVDLDIELADESPGDAAAAPVPASAEAAPPAGPIAEPLMRPVLQHTASVLDSWSQLLALWSDRIAAAAERSPGTTAPKRTAHRS